MIMKNEKKISRGATIRDVAEASGCSAMTVTRCFGKGYIARKTRQKIEAAARELGYVPNQLAQTLRHGKSNIIGGLWLLSMPHHTTHAAFMLGNSIGRAGYTPWINNTLAQWIQVRAALRDFLSHQIAGLIFQANSTLLGDDEVQQLLKGFPAVTLVLPYEVDLPYDQLLHRRGPAVKQIIDYLTSRGRRRICLIASEAANRNEAFIESTKNNPSIDAAEIVRPYDTHPFVGEGIYNALCEKYPDKIPFDAIISTSDEGAAAVIAGVKARGYRVPEDIAVVGWNDSDFSRYFSPPLATVDFNTEQLADTATEMLIERMKHPDRKKNIKSIDMKFIPRESAG